MEAKGEFINELQWRPTKMGKRAIICYIIITIA